MLNNLDTIEERERTHPIIGWCLEYADVETNVITSQRVELVRTALSVAIQQKRQVLQREVAHYTILAKKIDGLVIVDTSL